MAVIETDRLIKLYGHARGIEDVTVSIEKAEVLDSSAPTGRARQPRSAPCSTCCTRPAAVVLALTVILTMLSGLVAGADLSLGSVIAGYANVWPLALVFAGLGVVATGFSLRTSVVTGAVAGVLVTMYVLDLVGRPLPSSA